MRRLFFSRLGGAMLALALVIGSVSTAFADPRDFVLNNATGRVITEVYVTPSNLDDWGEDILGQDVLEAGQSVTIKFSRFKEGDCYYDVKVIVVDGGEGELNQVNLCETQTVTFN
ncbi:MAG: hypothetical protein IT306_02480 [Chloroflexi bacterium]|nr:hypothetical protein [Chloroflexota bacterium]